MPDIYMKKQIRALKKKYAYLIRAVEKYGTRQRALAAGNPVTGEGGPDLSEEEIDVALLLSALSTAERERDALKARCAELEARLQGAADRAIKWQIKLCEADHWSCKNCTECTDLRAAILGEKKE